MEYALRVRRKEVRGLREEEGYEESAGAGKTEKATADSPEIFCATRMEGGVASVREEAGGFVIDFDFVGFCAQAKKKVGRGGDGPKK